MNISLHILLLINNIFFNIGKPLKSTHSHMYTETDIWNCQTIKKWKERLQRSDPKPSALTEKFQCFSFLVCFLKIKPQVTSLRLCFREPTRREYSLATQWETEQKRLGRRVIEAEKYGVLLYSLEVVFSSLLQNGLNS